MYNWDKGNRKKYINSRKTKAAGPFLQYALSLVCAQEEAGFFLNKIKKMLSLSYR